MARTRASLDTIGYFDESYRLVEDYPFFMRALREGHPIGFWPKAAIKHRGGGVSDKKNPHPQFLKDLELCYEKEIYPYCENVDELRKELAQQEIKKQQRLEFEERWKDGSVWEKLKLTVQQPKNTLKKLYHIILKL